MCAQSCLTPGHSIDCSPPGSSVHGVFQATILEWVAISFSKGSSSLRDQTCVFWVIYHWATKALQNTVQDFLCGSAGKEPSCQCRRWKKHRFVDPWEDPLEKEMPVRSIILAWKILWSLADYSPWDCRIQNDWARTHTHVNYFVVTCSRAHFMM